MAGDESAGSEATAHAEAIDEALAAFEDACAQLTQAADDAADHPLGGRHLAAVRAQLAAVSVPVTAATADALLSAAADARSALQRVLAPGPDGEEEEDGAPTPGTATENDDDETDDETDDEELAEPDPVLDLAPEPDDEPVEPPPAPTGYRASTSLPTRNLPHVLVFEDGRWQRGSIVFAPDDTLVVRLATGRRGPGRRLTEYAPAQIARPQARG